MSELLSLESPIAQIGGEIVVSTPVSIGPFKSGDAELRLYSPNGNKAGTVVNLDGPSLRFPVGRVSPGMYSAEISYPAGNLQLYETIIIAIEDYEDRLDRFNRALDEKIKAAKLTGRERIQSLERVRCAYRELELHQLADEVEAEMEVSHPSRPDVLNTMGTRYRHPAPSIKIRLKRSPICTPEKHKRIVKSLGLKKVNRVVERPNTPAFRGMVAKVPHLLEIVN